MFASLDTPIPPSLSLFHRSRKSPTPKDKSPNPYRAMWGGWVETAEVRHPRSLLLLLLLLLPHLRQLPSGLRRGNGRRRRRRNVRLDVSRLRRRRPRRNSRGGLFSLRRRGAVRWGQRRDDTGQAAHRSWSTLAGLGSAVIVVHFIFLGGMQTNNQLVFGRFAILEILPPWLLLRFPKFTRIHSRTCTRIDPPGLRGTPGVATRGFEVALESRRLINVDPFLHQSLRQELTVWRGRAWQEGYFFTLELLV